MQSGARVSTADGQRRSMADVIYSTLKGEILSNVLPAGFQSYESDISDRLGASRTPVREAMILLEAEGLIEILPRRGFRVLPVKASDMKEIYEVLTALEPMAAQSISKQGLSGSDLATLEGIIAESEAAFAQSDLARWATGDDRFHREILRLHGNNRMVSITSILFSQAHRTQMVTLRMRSGLEKSNEEHREILEFIRGRHADEAGKQCAGIDSEGDKKYWAYWRVTACRRSDL